MNFENYTRFLKMRNGALLTSGKLSFGLMFKFCIRFPFRCAIAYFCAHHGKDLYDGNYK